MVRQDVNPQENSIRASNFGGLNTTASGINMPVTDASILLNVDVDVSGILSKRKGSDRYYEDTGSGKSCHSIKTNRGLEFLLLTSGNDIKVVYKGTLLKQLSGVFKSPSPCTYVTIPGEQVRALLLREDTPPVQVSVYEDSTVSDGTASVSFPIKLDTITNTAAYRADLKVFVDGVYDQNASVLLSIDGTTVTPSTVPTAGAIITTCYITWQWWAEAEMWYGDSFWKQVPRYGADVSDRLVLTPRSIYSDLPASPEYSALNLINLYYTSNSTSFAGDQLGLNDVIYNKVSSGFPSTETQYAFSNGAIPSDNFESNNTKTPFAVTFGEHSTLVEYTYQLDDLNFTNSRLQIINHGFKNGDLVEFTAPNILVPDTPLSFNFNTGHYVKVITPDEIEIYQSPGLVAGKFTFTPNPILTVASMVVSAGSVTTTVAHGLSSGDPVRVRSLGGVIPSGLLNDLTYYASVTSATTFDIKADHALQISVPTTNTGSGTVYWTHWNNYNIKKRNYSDVFFRRKRLLSFNNGRGVDYGVGFTDTLKWSIGNEWQSAATDVPEMSLNTQFYGIAITRNGPTLVEDYSFIGGSGSKQTEDTLCRLVHTDTKWMGTSALPDIYEPLIGTTHNGGVVPAYGLGFYADYFLGRFPTVGALHQERLVLSGFLNKPGTVIASAVADTKAKGEYYNYFQITDALENLTEDPFDYVVLDETNSHVNGFVSWQQLLFVFTEDAVFRSLNVNAPLSVSNRTFIIVSNSGLAHTSCTAVADSQIFYLSHRGLYDLPIVFEGEYRAQELSVKIQKEFLTNTSGACSMVYDKIQQRLYLSVNGKLFVYYLLTQAWSEYFFVSAPVIQDITVVYDTPLLVVDSPVYDGVLSLESESYMDYCQTFTSDLTPTTVLLKETFPASEGVTKFPVKYFRFSPFMGDADLKVMYDDGLGGFLEFVLDTHYNKTHDNSIELTTLGRSLVDGTDNIHIVPDYDYSWYGTGVSVGTTPGRIDKTLNDFGPLDLSVTTPITFDTNTYDLSGHPTYPYILDGVTVSPATVGYVYPSQYTSGIISFESLFTSKQITEVDFQLRLSKEPNNLSVGVQWNMYNTGDCYSKNLFYDTYNPVNQELPYVLFREHVTQTAVNFQVHAWDSTNCTFELSAWQVNLQPASGTGFVSGVM